VLLHNYAMSSDRGGIYQRDRVHTANIFGYQRGTMSQVPGKPGPCIYSVGTSELLKVFNKAVTHALYWFLDVCRKVTETDNYHKTEK
jgi:hypothetical protein